MRNSLIRAEGEAEAVIVPDDLQWIVGIGQVRAQQLNGLGIVSFGQLAEADTAGLAKALGCGRWAVEGWQRQAASLTSTREGMDE